jgi:hypothetical protein
MAFRGAGRGREQRFGRHTTPKSPQKRGPFGGQASSHLGTADVPRVVVLVVTLVRVLTAVPWPAVPAAAAAILGRPAVPPAATTVRGGVPVTAAGSGVVVLVVIVILVVLVLTVGILLVPAALLLVEVVANHLLHWSPDRSLRGGRGERGAAAKQRAASNTEVLAPGQGALA